MEREPTIDKDIEDENKSPSSVNASTIVKIGEYYLSTSDMFPTAEPQEPFEIHKTSSAFGGCISSSYLLDTSRGKFFIKEGYPLQMSLTILYRFIALKEEKCLKRKRKHCKSLESVPLLKFLKVIDIVALTHYH
jgi:hypothetical protein